MSTIRCVYSAEPSFPATDQSPDAVRYHIGNVWVDAVGGQPTQDEINAVLGVTANDLIKAQINALEQSAPITARAQRELALAVAAIIKTATGQDPASQGFVEAATLDAQIQTLRNELT